MQEITRIIQLYDQLVQSATPCALAVVVDVEQSSYRRIGARMLVAADGRFAGGISGGCLEGDALRRARRAILSEAPTTHVYDTLDGEDEVIGIGLGCNGRISVRFIPLDVSKDDNELTLLRNLLCTRVPAPLLRLLDGEDGRVYRNSELDALASDRQISASTLLELTNRQLTDGRSKVHQITDGNGQSHRLLIEILQPRIHLVLTGTNYDIPAALTAARHLGWRTSVIGPRRKFTTAISELADALYDYGEVEKVKVDAATAVVLMSHDYDWDGRMVQHFLPLAPPYLGMLGPRKRSVSMAEDLNLPELLNYENLYSPVGLDIGAETPEEIAASLVAEVVMVFRGRQGRALRERDGSIH